MSDERRVRDKKSYANNNKMIIMYIYNLSLNQLADGDYNDNKSYILKTEKIQHDSHHSLKM